MRVKITILFLVLFTTSIAFSQTTISGNVKDSDGSPLPGVNIQVKDSNSGTSTDFDGNYQIFANQGDILVFSSLGYHSQEITVVDSTQDVTLEEDANQLDEVVVTAFGVKRETRELGYSVTQVKTEDLELAGQPNAIAALQGRVAGLQITQTSGTSGGGVDILIRGLTSINPNRNNQPLIIVDGLALNNDTFSGADLLPSAGTNSPSSAEQFSFTNRGADINPEDIESFNILKGAAATALYGVRASNGAIIITTKKGVSGKAKISLTTSTTIRNIVKTPELQKTYREGFRGLPRTLYTPDTDTGFTRLGGTVFWSWGPRYTDDSATLNDGTVVDLTNDSYNSPYDLFQTGINTQLNFSISGATDKIDYFFSVGSNKESGVLPNTNYDKKVFRFKAGYKVSDNFNINTSIAYTNAGGNRANGGDKSVFSSLTYWSPTFPINDYQNPDGSPRNYTNGIVDNPRYFLEKSPLIDNVNRWVGNATMNWSPKDWINITYAAQVDNYSDQRNRFVGPELDTGSQVGGFIVEQNINFLGLESNLLAALSKDWSDDFSTTLTLGNQISDSKRDYAWVRGETLNIPGFNNLANTINKFAGKSVTQTRNVGVFGELKLDYKNKLFLTFTGRNDWISVLDKDKRSFFYPSVSLAYDVHDLFDKDGDFFTFGKLRASWAEVGKGPLFGQIGHHFSPDPSFPFGGSGGFRSNTRLGDDLIPERNRSIEVGADLRFFKNRLRMDYAYYRTRVKAQIFTVGTAFSTGLSGIVRNAGDFESFGHELLISGDIIKNDNFKWETILNWSTNEGKVLSLPEDIESLIFANSGFAGVTSEIRDGDKMGTLYGWKWRYENGQRYIGSDGKPRVDFDAGRQIVGNAFPDFVASIVNSLSYKNFNFNFLLEWKKGGDLYTSGIRNSIRNGILAITEFRDQTTVLDGVMDDGNGGFVTNTQEVLIDQDYYRSSTRYNRASEVIVQDASWVKLRNIGLTYNITGTILEKLHMDNFSISASAQNLLLWTPYVGFDPEGNQYSAGSNVYGFTGLGTPIAESYTFGINLGF
ncbi:MAG: SusC/RagA family TonB-linked outer membrane protein [Flavobacteriaceae bacterium]|nr:SusC/RagA family TonB-linked outer membrane protein [Flavobacteriaceae bacterium]